ncbi:MAG: Gfo/Idh/MocA family oxidoreductase [Steroidobacteraceae bacterium]|jgi:predicted dehydrogenase
MGIVGMSEGNGHPYSWSAIINGYDRSIMAECPFPAIPAYLAERRFPEDQLAEAMVTHIWTQDPALSQHIARATHIPRVVTELDEMLGQIDALLLARDDAENHRRHAESFLRAGLPVYLDKPPALSLHALEELYSLARNRGQIFSCSALRYAEELRLTPEEAIAAGELRSVHGVTPKLWDRYSPHIIDPAITFLRPGRVAESHVTADGNAVTLTAHWESGLRGIFEATGRAEGEIALTYLGAAASIKKVFRDSFSAFRSALRAFLDGVRSGGSPIHYEHIHDLVDLIERGCTVGNGRAAGL